MTRPERVKRGSRPPKITVSELQDLLHNLDRETERGAALVGLAFVEDSLGHALETKLKGDDNAVESVLGGSLASKLRLALALGLIGQALADECAALASIRNAFAHTRSDVSFVREDIAKSCRSLTLATLFSKRFGTDEPPRFLYSASVGMVTSFIGGILATEVIESGTDEAFGEWTESFLGVVETRLKGPMA